jgi:trans-aconitate methyltransferase
MLHSADLFPAAVRMNDGGLPMNIKWNAGKYASSFSFVPKFGSDLVKMIEVKRHMRVLDLGCGNGSLTGELERAGMHAIGLDASPEMLELARENHKDLEFIQADASDFTLQEPVSAVISNAVFHWIDADKQDAMMDCVYRCLEEDGQFVFEMGGFGNNAVIHAALKEQFEKRGLTYTMPFYFPKIGEYSAKLESHGFTVTEAYLFPRPTELEGEDGFEEWVEMFDQTPFAGMDEDKKTAIIHDAEDIVKPELLRDGKWYADYVRLRMKAVR